MKTPKRNIVTPYQALLADIRDFVAKWNKANTPKTVTRGTMAKTDLAWLGECVVTAKMLGFRVEVREQDSKTLEFVLIENTKQPEPEWRWR